MALRRPPTTFSDSIDASDLAANSVTASELADDAVDTAALADGAVDADRLASNAVTTVKIANDAVDADKLASNSVVSASIVDANITAAKIAAEAIEVKPHIIPGKLYPAMKDTGGTVRQLDGVTAVVASTVGPAGSTIASSLYGTVQSDGRMYYYTDIKGSKPIKDPRIGSHFGGQRYPTTSYQLLEQETATNGTNVYSVDGREWMKKVGDNWTTTYGSEGNYSHNATGDATNSYFFEIVGYFNAANYKSYTGSSRDINVFVDGTQNPSSTFTGGTATLGSPLGGRYVSNHSIINIPFTGLTSPAIRTLKLANVSGDYLLVNSIELIAQDTTSDTTRSQIQIHPQNVVSYGKKYTVAKEGLHYNPFAFKTDGTTAWASGAHNGTSWPVGTGSSHNIDTATSLGLDKWLHSSNYYKPYNGGRVVIWVDSSGNVKTSVTVMPPNARSILTTAITAKANASVANDTYLPTFEAGSATAYETTALAEVAKTFHMREFGNGAANAGTNSTKADASMVSATADDLGYVMDDGLTSLSAKSVTGVASSNNPRLQPERLQAASSDHIYITFIGTGITFEGTVWADNAKLLSSVAQNLPYGTHIFKISRPSNLEFWIDGVRVRDSGSGPGHTLSEVSIHQPNMPPIPEDAVILADYMLMADFVPQTANGIEKISKGVRLLSSSRDFLHDATNGTLGMYHIQDALPNTAQGFHVAYKNMTSEQGPQLTYFGDAKVVNMCGYAGDSVTSMIQHFDGATTNVTVSSAYTDSGAVTTSMPSSGNGHYYVYGTKTTGTMGVQTVKHLGDELGSSSDDWVYHDGIQVSTPIHTSSHYQSFETPYLYELVGGDRNMEQTNLVITSDGKTWDEVTRDTSYIGNIVVSAVTDTETDYNSVVVLDEWRGVINGTFMFNKDFAISYDRIICLKDGQYKAQVQRRTSGTGEHTIFFINGNQAYTGYSNVSEFLFNVQIVCTLKRGDFIQLQGEFGVSNANYNQFSITRI